MKVVEQFKRRILDLAIRGKLVPQDPNDEPASELLARIKAEKEKLIKAGKIKNGKCSVVGSDGAAYEKLLEDASFELPKGWAWCKLNDVLLSLHTGLNPRQFFKLNTPDATNYYVTIRELKNNQVIFNNRTDRINNTALHLCNKRSNLEVGDILFGGTGSIGATAIVSAPPVNWNIKEGVYALKPNQKAILPHFLLYLLQAPTIKKLYMEQAVGATVLSVPMKEMNTLPIPLPPLAEQSQIVSRIEELFKIADRLGEAAGGLEAAARCLDKKILDLAIRGKLVAQDPSDEPASELLKRIAITSHKSPCKNHEKPVDLPFDIPKSWEWVRLGNVSDIIRGTGIKRNETSQSGVQCVRYGEIYTDYGYSFSRSVSHVPLAVAEKCHEATFGDVLCTLTGENEVEIAKATAYLGKDRLVIGGDLAKITNHPYDPMLLVYFLFSPFMISQKAGVCTGGMIVHMGKSALSNLLIPLPPIAEQKRIVAKIEELRKVTQALTM